MADLTCPSLGTGSVDFNAFNDAAKKARTAADLSAALDKATTGGAPDAVPANDIPATPAAAPAVREV